MKIILIIYFVIFFTAQVNAHNGIDHSKETAFKVKIVHTAHILVLGSGLVAAFVVGIRNKRV